MSKAARRILAVCIALTLCLLAIELVARVLSVATIGPLVPQKSIDFAAREHNSAGFHDVEWTLAKPDGAWRLVVLGDSFTMGQWVPRDELFVKRLERELRERDESIEVMNFALGGLDTSGELDVLRRTALAYAPDAVLLVFFLNDATHLDSNPLMVKKIHAELAREPEGLARVSKAWELFDRARRKRAVTRATVDDYLGSFHGDAEKREAWERCKRALADLAALCRERGLPFGVAIFPMLMELEDDAEHPFESLYAEVAAHCRSLDVPLVELLPVFRGRSAPGLWVAPDDAHPNTIANLLVVPPLLEFVEQHGLVPR